MTTQEFHTFALTFDPNAIELDSPKSDLEFVLYTREDGQLTVAAFADDGTWFSASVENNEFLIECEGAYNYYEISQGEAVLLEQA